MRIIIAGGGSIGERLGEFLVKEKHDVIIIEKDEKRAEELGEKLDAIVLYGDASDRKVLKDSNIEKCDVFVVMTGDDKTNLMICEVAKTFNVPVIVSRINDPSNEQIFTDLGINATINITASVILTFKKILESPERRLVGIVGGDAEIFEIPVRKDSKICGKKIEQIKNACVVVGLVRKNKFLKPKANMKITEGDTVVVCCPVKDVKKLKMFF